VRVLAIDPGLTRCGVGVIDGAAGRRVTMLHAGVVRTPVAAEVGERLLLLEAAMESLVQQYEPEAVAVERVFAQHNVSTVMGTAQAAGIAMLVAARHGLPVGLHTPSEVKAAVTGSGRAEKAQVAAMVVRVLGLTEAPRPVDATDALALGICHAWRGAAAARVEAAVRAQALARGAR
jgi:crossover junction endodeoxyribonuclease RuvC